MRISRPDDPTQWPEIWQAAYRILEEKIPTQQLKTWIQPIQFLGTETTPKGNLFRLGVNNDFASQWLKDHHQESIEEALSQVTGSKCLLEFVTQQKPHGESALDQKEVHAEDKGVVLAPGVQSADRAEKGRFYTIDPRYTFESFVVGASNQFAHASAIAVAENPAQQYNPLFIYSPPGLGKTHLLHAIGNHVMSKNPSARVAYLSAEGFVNELIDSIQHQKTAKFRAKYRDSYDVILIDDIQFIAGKKQTEEEFFHTFNALHYSKRQIVLTSDRPPKEIDKLEERIRTRFEWGLVADVQPPEIETRIAILKAKAERDDLYLPDDVATYLASHFHSNVRELEGTLIRLQAQASLTGAEISLEMAKQELRLVIREEDSQVTPQGIQDVVAKHFGLKIQDLKSSVRSKSIALPRHIAMFLVRKYTGLGWKNIGEYFEKDHTTVMHAYEKIETEYETVSEVREAVEAIQNRL